MLHWTASAHLVALAEPLPATDLTTMKHGNIIWFIQHLVESRCKTYQVPHTVPTRAFNTLSRLLTTNVSPMATVKTS